MIYLILAIICSSLISVLMRLSENKRKSRVGLFIFNYAVCVILSAVYIPNGIIPGDYSKIGITIGLGVISGILYLLSFALMQLNIKENGIIPTSIFMKLGVVVSILIAILVFRNIPTYLQIIGMVLAIAAIIVFNYQKGSSAIKGKTSLLIILLITSGITDSTVNIFNNVGNPEQSDHFLMLNFFFAGICSIILYFIQKEKLGKWDIIFGLIIGIPNYYSSRFLMLALREVPAPQAYPIYSVATILLIGIVGIIAFKEKLSRQKWVGLLMVAGALVMLQ